MNHIRSRSSLMVNVPALHRSNLMTPLERIFSEGDARLKMTASWELVKLEDGPQVRGIRWAINSSIFDNVYLIWLSCASWRSAKTPQLKPSTPAIFRASCCETDILRSSSTKYLLLPTIASPRGQRLLNRCNMYINSPCLVRLVVFILNDQMLRCR